MAESDSTAAQTAATNGAPATEPKRRPSLWAKLAILAVSLLVCGLMAELFVLVAVGEQPKFPRHVVRAPWGLRYNEPDANYRHKSADVTTYFRINSRGMRDDREFSYAKPAGVKRIVSLGDSFTIGYEVDVEQSFSRVLEEELKKAGIRSEVLNAGVSGFSNAEELVYLERELFKYSPDLVLLSFYSNDFEDNVRSNLFRLENGVLKPHDKEYIPAGGLGDYLNTSWFFNLLSERSNAFVFAKERITIAMKRDTVARNQARVNAPGATSAAPPLPAASASTEPKRDYPAELAGAILNRLYEELRKRGIPLVIQSIPDLASPDGRIVPLEQRRLIDLFPYENFDTKRPGVHCLSAKEWLEPHRGKQTLYWTRSHWHWTPFSHRLSGQSLAALVVKEQLLK